MSFVRRTLPAVALVASGWVLAPFALAAIAALMIGIVTAPLLVGVPVVAAALLAARMLAGLDRTLTSRLLGHPIDVPESLTRGASSPSLSDLLVATSTWRAVGWAGLRLVVAAISAVVVAVGLTGLVTAAGAVVVDGYLVSGVGNDRWTSTAGLASLWLAPVAVAVMTATIALVVLLGRGLGAAAMRLLGPDEGDLRRAAQARASRLSTANRLARDLHDSVGHALTVTVLQAAAARTLLATGDGDTADVVSALRRIEESARDAVGQVDVVLAALREEDSSLETSAPPSPVESLLLVSVERARALGLGLDVRIDADLDVLPSPVLDVARRVVQEGVTNTLRHGGNGPATLVVERSASGLVVELVTPAADGTRRGRGLVGLAERAHDVGGRVDASPAPDGRWVVRAEIPVPTAVSA